VHDDALGQLQKGVNGTLQALVAEDLEKLKACTIDGAALYAIMISSEKFYA
jgi:hypothetical protein